MSDLLPQRTNLGDLILISEGEHDGYTVTSVALAMKRFNPLDERDRYLQTLPLEDRYRELDRKAFVQWLVDEKLIMTRPDLNHLHLGEFDDASRVTYNGHGRGLNLP